MKTIHVINCLSTDLDAGYDGIKIIEIDDKPFNEGMFGDLYRCNSIDGRSPSRSQVIKIFKADADGNDKRGFITIRKLQNRIKSKNSDLQRAGKPTIADLPAFFALPQFSYEGNLGSNRVIGYSANWLDPGRFHNFEDVLTELRLLNQYLRLSLNLRLQCALDLAEAFSILRDIQYIHADVNPLNLFVSFDDGHLIIIDYDSGAVVENANDSPTTYGKQNEWLAPEVVVQLIGNNHVVRVDVFTDTWAVAVGIHYLLFGLFPFFFLNDFSSSIARKYLSRSRWPLADFNDKSFLQQERKRYKQYRDLYDHQVEIKELARGFEATFNEGLLKPDRRLSYVQWVQRIRPLVKPVPFAVSPHLVGRAQPPKPPPKLQPKPPAGTQSASTRDNLFQLLLWGGLVIGGAFGFLISKLFSDSAINRSIVIVASLTATALTFARVRPSRSWNQCAMVAGCLGVVWFLFPLYLSPLAWSITYGTALVLAAPRLVSIYQRKGWKTALKVGAGGSLVLASAVLSTGLFLPDWTQLKWNDGQVTETKNSATVRPPPPASGTARPPVQPHRELVAGESTIGPLRIGTSVGEAARSIGIPIVRRKFEHTNCAWWSPESEVDGIRFLVADGRIAVADIWGVHPTTRGLRVGDQESKLKKLYGNELRAIPAAHANAVYSIVHEPVGQGAQGNRIVFRLLRQEVLNYFVGDFSKLGNICPELANVIGDVFGIAKPDGPVAVELSAEERAKQIQSSRQNHPSIATNGISLQSSDSSEKVVIAPPSAIVPRASELQLQISRAMIDNNIRGISVYVSNDLTAALKGTLSNAAEKERAFQIIGQFKHVRSVRDQVFVVE